MASPTNMFGPSTFQQQMLGLGSLEQQARSQGAAGGIFPGSLSDYEQHRRAEREYHDYRAMERQRHQLDYQPCREPLPFKSLKPKTGMQMMQKQVDDWLKTIKL